MFVSVYTFLSGKSSLMENVYESEINLSRGNFSNYTVVLKSTLTLKSYDKLPIVEVLTTPVWTGSKYGILKMIWILFFTPTLECSPLKYGLEGMRPELSRSCFFFLVSVNLFLFMTFLPLIKNSWARHWCPILRFYLFGSIEQRTQKFRHSRQKAIGYLTGLQIRVDRVAHLGRWFKCPRHWGKFIIIIIFAKYRRF